MLRPYVHRKYIFAAGGSAIATILIVVLSQSLMRASLPGFVTLQPVSSFDIPASATLNLKAYCGSSNFHYFLLTGPGYSEVVQAETDGELANRFVFAEDQTYQAQAMAVNANGSIALLSRVNRQQPSKSSVPPAC